MTKSTPPKNGLSDFICFSVYSANHAFNRIYKPLLDRLKLTYPQYLAMVVLWTEDNQTVGQMGESLFLESNTLTPLLKRLETLGYIERARDAADERQVRVKLTAKGRKLQDEARCVPEGVLEASGLSIDKLRRMNTDITGLRDQLLSFHKEQD